MVRAIKCFCTSAIAVLFASCATPPTANPSAVESTCAQQCSTNLATCSAGFKLFPIVQQKQCNDNYDICIRGCPARVPDGGQTKSSTLSTSERLAKLDELLKSGAITKEEYDAKRKAILDSL